MINWPEFSVEASNFYGNLNISEFPRYIINILVLRDFDLFAKFSRDFVIYLYFLYFLYRVFSSIYVKNSGLEI